MDSMLLPAVGQGVSTVRGAFATCFNLRNRGAVLVDQGVLQSSVPRNSDMHWQAFMVNRWDGAAQPVNTKVDGCIGLIIGNHHIVQGGKNAYSEGEEDRSV